VGLVAYGQRIAHAPTSNRPKGSTSEVGILDLEIGRRNHRSLGLGQAGTERQTEDMAGAMGYLEQMVR